MTRETPADVYKVHRNLDPTLHPLQQAREFKRALNAAKMEKIFAKPFVSALSEHTDSVFGLCRSDRDLSLLFSGSANGEVKLWDLCKMKCVETCQAHQGAVTGVCFRQGFRISAGQDSVVSLWRDSGKLDKYKSSESLTGVDLSWTDPSFVTSSQDGISLWDLRRSCPIQQYSSSSDTLTRAKFNPSETHLICAVGNDRGILLIDSRSNTLMHKIKLKLKSNDISWNPQEPINFTVANEDGNLYSFDMRNLSEASKIHKDHLNAVTCVSYSPTGREFASGSFDKTVRIFDIREGRSREVYHTRRMQWIYAVEFSGDAKFVLTGSDDTNIRVWKAKAHLPVKVLLPREQEAIWYRERLKKKFRFVPEMRRLLKHRHLPRYLYSIKRQKHVMEQSKWRKSQNVQAHTKAENLKIEQDKKKVVVE
jgi:WD repeat and SOF domain-containing protein 1